MTAVTLTGDWNKLLTKLDSLRDIDKVAKSVVGEEAERVAKTMVSDITSQNLPFAPLKSSTIAIKGNSKLFIDTGKLVSSIGAKPTKDGYFVGVDSSAVNSEGISYSQIMQYLELGTRYQAPRPFLRYTYDKSLITFNKNASRKLADFIMK